MGPFAKNFPFSLSVWNVKLTPFFPAGICVINSIYHLSLWELSEKWAGAGGAQVTLSLHTEDLAQRLPQAFSPWAWAGRWRKEQFHSGSGVGWVGRGLLRHHLLRTPQIKCQLPGPNGVSWRSLKNDFPAVKGCAIVLLLGHLLSGWPTGSSHAGQPEWVKSKGQPYSSRPATIPALSAVWCQIIKGPAYGPVFAHHSPHRPLELSQVRGGARRKFAAPEGALGVVNSQGRWQERGKFRVLWFPIVWLTAGGWPWACVCHMAEAPAGQHVRRDQE